MLRAGVVHLLCAVLERVLSLLRQDGGHGDLWAGLLFLPRGLLATLSRFIPRCCVPPCSGGLTDGEQLIWNDGGRWIQKPCCLPVSLRRFYLNGQ